MNESTFLVYVNLIAETLAAHHTLYRIRKSLDWYNSAKDLAIANGIFVDDPTSDNIEMNPILIAVVKMAILDHPADFNFRHHIALKRAWDLYREGATQVNKTQKDMT